MAFVKDTPAEAASLVAGIQQLREQHKDKDLRTFVVFLGGPELKRDIEKVAADKKLNLGMTFLPGGASQGDLRPYRINPQAKNTVLVYVGQQVKARFVDVTEKSLPDVAKATAAMLGK